MEDKTSEFSFILRPSGIPDGGVGVFVLHDIKKGTKLDIASEFSNTRNFKVNELPKPLEGYCIFNQDGTIRCPREFNHMRIGWYVNHSKDPNIVLRDGCGFFATKHIPKDAELLMDYNSFKEPEELKEDYYK